MHTTPTVKQVAKKTLVKINMKTEKVQVFYDGKKVRTFDADGFDVWDSFKVNGKYFDIHVYAEETDNSDLSVTIYPVKDNGKKLECDTSVWANPTVEVDGKPLEEFKKEFTKTFDNEEELKKAVHKLLTEKYKFGPNKATKLMERFDLEEDTFFHAIVNERTAQEVAKELNDNF